MLLTFDAAHVRIIAANVHAELAARFVDAAGEDVTVEISRTDAEAIHHALGRPHGEALEKLAACDGEVPSEIATTLLRIQQVTNILATVPPDGKAPRRCPICSRIQGYDPRHARCLCVECVGRLVDVNGRPIHFRNTGALGTGCEGRYSDTDESYSSLRGYVDGLECIASEHRFGGIVVEPIQGATTPTG